MAWSDQMPGDDLAPGGRRDDPGGAEQEAVQRGGEVRQEGPRQDHLRQEV